MNNHPTYLDLFAGAGGLSEGFVRAGYKPVAHVEMNVAACYTLKTRQVFHWLRENGEIEKYYQYIRGKLPRQKLYEMVPSAVVGSVLNYEITQSILNELFDQIDNLIHGSVDVIVGGPPCQAYSLVGRARDSESMKNDERNYLYRMYARFLERYKPKYFVFENVTGLLSAKNKSGHLYLDVMKRLFRSKGYATGFRIVSSDDYGVPQRRKRVILIGKKLEGDERASSFSYPQFVRPNIRPCTINELFSDLPRLHAGDGDLHSVSLLEDACSFLYDTGIRSSSYPEASYHVARRQTDIDLEIYKIAAQQWKDSKERLVYSELPPNLIRHNNVTSFLDRYKVVDGSSTTSHTVVAHIHKDGHYYIHPDVEQNRSLTPREVARLQTFPDDYFFESATTIPSPTCAYRQIGNAVPVLLAECIALGLKGLL